MRLFAAFVVMLVACRAGAFASDSVPALRSTGGAFALSSVLFSPVTVTGQRIVLTVTVKNVSDMAIESPVGSAEWDKLEHQERDRYFNVTVTDAKGHYLLRASVSSPGPVSAHYRMMQMRPEVLRPGQSTSVDIELSREFDLSRAGEYTITADLGRVYWMPGPGGKSIDVSERDQRLGVSQRFWVKERSP